MPISSLDNSFSSEKRWATTDFTYELEMESDEQAKVRERIRCAVASLADNIPKAQRVAEQRA